MILGGKWKALNTKIRYEQINETHEILTCVTQRAQREMRIKVKKKTTLELKNAHEVDGPW